MKANTPPKAGSPIITEPFSRVHIDLFSLLSLCISDGHQYISSLIDFGTAVPEAVPLKDIDSVSVAEAFLFIFSLVWIPLEDFLS